MSPYQQEFIEFCLMHGVLKFGEFKLKSGRLSPYFFNAGMFKNGEAFYQLGKFYAETIHTQVDPNYTVLFGPAYKGIALATAVSIGLKIKYNQNVSVTFNRKEIKDHGEGGMIIGEPLLNQRVLLIDDVITAGTTVREAIQIIQKEGGQLVGIVIALDRQEIGLDSSLSAIQEVRKKLNINVASIITCDDLIQYLANLTQKGNHSMNQHLDHLRAYREQYGTVVS